MVLTRGMGKMMYKVGFRTFSCKLGSLKVGIGGEGWEVMFLL